MRGDRALLGILAAASIAGGWACFRPTIRFQVQRGSPASVPASPSGSDHATKIAIPRHFLNRYELVEQSLGDCPMGFHDYIDDGRDDRRNASFETERRAAAQLASCSATRPPFSDADPQWSTISRSIVSFVHITDVQIREARAKLGDERQSRGLDRLIDSFEHDFDQELYLDAVLDAMVMTVNATVEDRRDQNGVADPLPTPEFAVHTGDAVDAGLQSELDTFVRVLDRLDIPWLSAIGNHDVLTFGNFVPGERMSTETLLRGLEGRILDNWYGPILQVVASAWIVTDPEVDLSTCAGCDERLIANRAKDRSFVTGFVEPHCRGSAARIRNVTTRCHGFDLSTTRDGHYTFRLELSSEEKRRVLFDAIRVVVLNTSDFGHDMPDRGGEGGYLSRAQLDWLDDVLGFEKGKGASGPVRDNEVVLVVGHHPITTIRGNGNGDRLAARLEDLAAKRRLVAYLTGHNHEHEINLYCPSRTGPRPENSRRCGQPGGFWEIQTSSIISFPQEARFVALRAVSPELGFLELIPFSHTVVMDGTTPFRRALAIADAGAARDVCRRHGCARPRREDGQHTAVRLFIPLPEDRTP